MLYVIPCRLWFHCSLFTRFTSHKVERALQHGLCMDVAWDLVCGTAAVSGPFVWPTCDTPVEYGQAVEWHRRTLAETWPSASLCATNPTWTELGQNQGLGGETQTSYGLCTSSDRKVSSVLRVCATALWGHSHIFMHIHLYTKKCNPPGRHLQPVDFNHQTTWLLRDS
jgi:hypothetical protein